MLSRSDLLARLRPELRRQCPMDMSPESIACREGRNPPRRQPGGPGRQPAPPRRAPRLPMPPEIQPPTIMPVEPPQQEIVIPEFQQPIMLPPRMRPTPPVDDSPCPPYPIICNQSMSPSGIACREKAKRCSGRRVGLPRAPPQFDRGIFTPSMDMGGFGVGLEPMTGFIGEGKKKRGRPRKHTDEELEGGFLGALASLGRIGATIGRTAATVGRTAATAARSAATAARVGATAARTGATAARTTAITARTAATAARTAPTIASRLGALGTRISSSTLGRYGLTAYKGLSAISGPVGLAMLGYQIADTIKAKKDAERLAAEGDAQAAKDAEELKNYLADLNKAKEDYEKAKTETEAAATQQEADYKKAEAEAKAAYEEQAKRDAEALEEYRRQQEEQLALMLELEAQRQQQMEEAIRRALESVSRPSPPAYVPPPSVPPPSRGGPTAPPQQPVAPPQQQPPSRGRSGKPRVGNGKGKRKVKFNYY